MPAEEEDPTYIIVRVFHKFMSPKSSTPLDFLLTEEGLAIYRDTRCSDIQSIARFANMMHLVRYDLQSMTESSSNDLKEAVLVFKNQR